MARIVRDLLSSNDARAVPVPRVVVAPVVATPAAEPMSGPTPFDAALLEAARAAAHDEGRSAGYREGVAEAAAQWQARLQQLADITARLTAERASDLAALEDSVVLLTYEACVRMVGGLLATPDAIRAIVQRVLEQAAEQAEPLVLRVSPADQVALAAHLDELRQRSGNPALQIVADARLAHGGCVLETTRGNLDARLERQFQRLRELLLEARKSEGDAV